MADLLCAILPVIGAKTVIEFLHEIVEVARESLGSVQLRP
jgi:hypothetical protein